MAELFQGLTAWLAGSGIDEVLGFLSSVVAVVGVPGALWQAWRARSAAQAAAAASRDAVSKLTTLRTIMQLSAVLQQLEEVKTFNRLGAGGQAIERYSRLRNSLVEIRAREAAFSDQERSTLQQTIAILAELERELDRVRERGGDHAGFAEANARLSEEMDRLSELLAGLERRSLRTGHGH